MTSDVMTPAEYLLAERRNEFKSEYRDGRMVPMLPFNATHCDISGNLSVALGNRLKGSPWRRMGSGMRIKVPVTGLYTYPDGLVYYDQPAMEDAERDTLLNPVVLIEVLSEATSAYDRGRKFRHYERCSSLREYVLVEPNEPLIERYVRLPGNCWSMNWVSGLDAEFTFATVPVTIPMAEIYENVTFPDPPPPLR
jgi:Uma2 family endonuclease